MYFSLQEREKRDFFNYQKVQRKLEKLSDDELNSRYVTAKSKYDYKKNMFFVITILIIIFTIFLKCFSGIYKESLKVVILNQSNLAEEAKIVLIILLMIFIIIVVFVVFAVAFHLRGLSDIYKDLLCIEKAIEKRFNYE